MSWDMQLLLAEALADGGTLVAADPAGGVPASLDPRVCLVTPAPVPMALGLGPGRAVAVEVPGLSSLGPNAARPVAVDLRAMPPGSERLWQEIGRRLGTAPEVVIDPAGARPGYVPVQPGAVLLVAETAPGLLDRLSRVRPGVEVACFVRPASAARGGALARVGDDGATVLDLEPLRFVRGLDAGAARSLALAGQLGLRHGQRWRLRLPAAPDTPWRCLLSFSGPLPHHPPVATALSPGLVLSPGSGKGPRGPVLDLRAGRATEPWVEIALMGSRLVVDRAEITVGPPAASTGERYADPLDAYGDPLGGYDRAEGP